MEKSEILSVEKLQEKKGKKKKYTKNKVDLENILRDIILMSKNVNEDDLKSLQNFKSLLIKNSLEETLRLYDEDDRVKVKIKEGFLHYFKFPIMLDTVSIQRLEIHNIKKRERVRI